MDDEALEALARIVGSGIEGSAEVVKAVIGLVGNAIQAIGVAAAAVDPLQFAFVVGTALVALNYLDQTEPYKTIIAKLKLHGLIAQLHAPGEGQQDFATLKNAADCCIVEYQFAGIPVPPGLYQLRDVADTGYGVFQLVDSIIPGAGLLQNYISQLYGGLSPTQLYKNGADAIKAACKQATGGYDCANLPKPPGNAPPGWIGPALYPVNNLAAILVGQVRGPYADQNAALIDTTILTQKGISVSIIAGTDRKDWFVKITALPWDGRSYIAGPFPDQQSATKYAVSGTPTLNYFPGAVIQGTDKQWYVVAK